ncbi:MAG: trigger factor [Gallionellales bacterium GWA2_60_18]|nr:MAG: trigger factor [Gallionellales bacterium GWA2_60_18]
MTSVETVSALERRLNASIPQQSISNKVATRLKNIGRTAKIAGFRPGKIPARVLEQHYGAQARQEALGDALQLSFDQAAQLNNLKVAGYPKFEVKTSDLNADEIEYSATFEVYPEVAVGDLSGEALERLVYELTQDDVNNTIMTLRKQRATFDTVERAAQDGDRVHIDFVGKLDGEVFKGGEAKNYPVTLGSGSMLVEFETAILGMKAGETRSFDMTFPEDYHGKDVAGKQVTFTITLNKVEAPKLPELDGEFCVSIGIEGGDVAKLEGDIRANLQREISRRLKTRNKEAAMEALLKVAQFDLPKAVLDWEIQELMQQTMQDMESRGMKMNGMKLPPDLFAERAEKRAKLGLILADMVQKHDLKAKPDQLQAMVEEYAQSFEHPEEVARWYYADQSRLQEVANAVMEDNLVAWVMGQARTADKPISFDELMGS